MLFDNFKLYVNLHVPEGRTIALVIMVHGIGEHGGCYDEWAEKFVTQSVGFLTFDMRGHGRSPGIRGHASLNALKNDLRSIIDVMRKKYADIPIVLFGHSMGGQLALSHAFDENVMVQGVIASSPLLKLINLPSPLLVKTAKWASYVAPWFTVKTGIKAEQLSHTGAENRKSTKTDPLLQKKISIKLFSDLFANGEMLIRNEHFSSIPILLMHGSDDKIVSFEVNETFAKNNQNIIDFKQWRNMYHDLLFDTGKEEVFGFVMNWLSKNIIEKWSYSEQS